MRPVTVAATQFSCAWDLPANADRAEALVRQAAAQGANVVLVQELFATPYFCIEERAWRTTPAPAPHWPPAPPPGAPALRRGRHWRADPTHRKIA